MHLLYDFVYEIIGTIWKPLIGKRHILLECTFHSTGVTSRVPFPTKFQYDPQRGPGDNARHIHVNYVSIHTLRGRNDFTFRGHVRK